MTDKVMIVQMPAGVQNERLVNQRLADANTDGWYAHALRQHNGLLLFTLNDEENGEQKIVMELPDEQFEKPINERLAKQQADGWRLATVESHNGFLVLLLDRRGRVGS